MYHACHATSALQVRYHRSLLYGKVFGVLLGTIVYQRTHVKTQRYLLCVFYANGAFVNLKLTWGNGADRDSYSSLKLTYAYFFFRYVSKYRRSYR